jgi:hypothetical protein
MTRAEDIVKKVQQKELDNMRLYERMDADYSLWRSDDFHEKDDTGVGFEQYTSNDPRTFGRKSVSILAGAAVTFQTVQNNDNRSARDRDNAAEMFAIGNFKANDERLARMGDIPLRAAMSWDLCIRGRTTGRALLVRDRDQSWADATRFDPRNCTWEPGADGMLWFCHKVFKSRAQVKDEYGKSKPDTDETELVAVYDYYDKQLNTVVIPEVQETPVRNRRHGMRRNPCWNVSSTLQPMVLLPPSSSESQGASYMGDSLVDYGESIYAENRKIWPAYQKMMSIMMELASRSRKPIFGIESDSGMKLVEGNPFQDGSEIPLRTGEKLIVYDMLQSAPDLMNFMSIVSGNCSAAGSPSSCSVRLQRASLVLQ